jgi:hypothetical protein
MVTPSNTDGYTIQYRWLHHPVPMVTPSSTDGYTIQYRWLHHTVPMVTSAKITGNKWGKNIIYFPKHPSVHIFFSSCNKLLKVVTVLASVPTYLHVMMVVMESGFITDHLLMLQFFLWVW